MGIHIQLHPRDMADLNREINRLAEGTGKTLKEVLPSQMRLLAADLAFVTVPKGRGSQDNAKNMLKVRARIAEIYPTIGRIVSLLKKETSGLAGNFAGLISKRQYAKAQNITDRYLPEMKLSIGSFDNGELHRSQSEQKTISRRLLVPGYTRVTAYANKTARRVGFAKGSFATAARQLGGVRGIPGFATRQKSPGTGSVRGDGKTLTVTMTSEVTYLREALKPHDEGAAVGNRSRQVGLVLKRVQDRKVKAAMRKFQ